MVSTEISSLSSVSIVITLVALLITTLYCVLLRRGLPPGPKGLPYFGLWPFLKETTCHLELNKMNKLYGDVCSFTYTGRLYINLGSINAVREAHITKGDCFEKRVTGFSIEQVLFEGGVGLFHGEAWKVQRKFFLQTMKERGVKALREGLAGSLNDLVKATVDELRARNGEPTNIIELLTKKSTTTLRLTLFGDGVTEERMQDLIQLYGEMVASMTPLNTLLIGTFAKYFIFPLKSECRTTIKCSSKMHKLLHVIIEEHKATYNEEHARDVIDDYIKERNHRQKNRDPTAVYFTDHALLSSLVQFVGDGSLSVSYFTSFMIKCLIDHPEEQEKLFQELEVVVGSERLPSLEDKSKLPYMSAFMTEVSRNSDFFPFFPSLECTKETTLRGYRIPKGAITLMNFWSCHNDPAVYEEPETFNPSRFISKDGQRRQDTPILFGQAGFAGQRHIFDDGLGLRKLQRLHGVRGRQSAVVE